MIFDKIQASDIGAKIINTNETATITITNTNQEAFLYHGQIENHINIINLQDASKTIAFDGSINNPDGTFTHNSGSLIFQGHPYIHAYLDKNSDGAKWNVIKEALGQEVFTTPTTLTQNDWEDRIFIFKEITTQSGSTFTLGRNAVLLANLNFNGTTAKFGGEAQIYIDRYDGENVVYKGNNTHEFRQQLTSGISEKNDSFFYEGDLSLRENSYLEVYNTQKNPLRFGRFRGINKQSKANGILDSKNVSYQLNIDNTSNAKVTYLELYGAKISGDINKKAIVTNNGGKIVVQNLIISDGTSTIEGEIEFFIDTTNSKDSTNPQIIFSNLEDKIHFLGSSSLTLTDSATLLVKTGNLDWKNLTYKNSYTLIASQATIKDNRKDKNIEFSGYIPSFIHIKSISEDHRIAIGFSNNISPNIINQENWVNQYASTIISTNPNADIKNFTQATKGNETLIKALIETNLEGKKIYQDIYLDMLIQEAGNGNITPLQTYLRDIDSKISGFTSQKVSLLIGSIFNSSQHSYLKNAQATLQARTAINSKKINLKKEYLAYKENTQTITADVKSDFTSLSPLRGYLLQEDKAKRLWIDTHGSFFSGKQLSFYNLGLSGGYDHTILAQDEKYLTLGTSLHYTFSQYKQNNTNTQSHNIIGGLHTQYIYKSHEMLFNLYSGGSFDNNHLSSTQTINSNSIATQVEGYYKYHFNLLKTDNFYHAVKPVLGIGYTWFYIPKESFGEFGGTEFIQISKINIHNPFIKSGIEYNIATEHTQTVFAIFATYNTKYLHERDVFIGTARPIQYNINLHPIWIETSLASSYLIADNFSLKCILATQYVPQSYYGISGSIGGSWIF